MSAKALLTSLNTNDTNPNYDRRAFGSWVNGRCIGTALLDLPRVDNTHTAELDLNVPPEQRRAGVGHAPFEQALAVALEHGRATISDEINVPSGQTLDQSPGGRFALARGLRRVHTEQRLMLDLPAPELNLPAVPGYTVVSWTGPTPARWLDAYAQLNTLMDQDVPLGERDRDPVVYDAERIRAAEQRSVEQGYGLVTTLVLDQSGEPAAYTKMFVTDPEHVLQDDTFVLRAHRGRRLGAAVKSANLAQLVRHHPQVRHVHTWTADVNDAMRAINERFGFRAVETTHMVQGIMS